MKKNKKNILIIGGGTSGLTIANRLQDFFDVTVIEKSEYFSLPSFYKIPLSIGLLFRKKKQNYITQKQIKLSFDRSIPFFESNVLGGASVINGCVHVLGNKQDWIKTLECFDLTFKDLEESYKSIYSTDVSNKGKISIKESSKNELDEIFYLALSEKGLEYSNLIHSDKVGFGPLHNTIHKIFRSSVTSLIKKQKFKIFMKQKVESISPDFKSNKVLVATKDMLYKPDYLIISAGVIGTFDVLYKSQERLGKIDNNLGEFIKDHTNLRINVLTKDKIGSLNEIDQSIIKKFQLFFKHIMGLPSLMTGTGATSGVHLDLDNDGIVDTRIQIVQFSEKGRHGSDGSLFNKDPGFSLSITPIRPRSYGKITKNHDKISINPNYLSANSDLLLLKKALLFSINLLKSDPFKGIVKEILEEGFIISNPIQYIRQNIYSGHHLIGGSSKLINNDMSAKFIPRTFICDASVFSDYTTSNIHSSIVLLSDMFAKNFIKKFS